MEVVYEPGLQELVQLEDEDTSFIASPTPMTRSEGNLRSDTLAAFLEIFVIRGGLHLTPLPQCQALGLLSQGLRGFNGISHTGEHGGDLCSLEEQFVADINSPDPFSPEMINKESARRSEIRAKLLNMPDNERNEAKIRENERQRQWEELWEQYRRAAGTSPSSISLDSRAKPAPARAQLFRANWNAAQAVARQLRRDRPISLLPLWHQNTSGTESHVTTADLSSDQGKRSTSTPGQSARNFPRHLLNSINSILTTSNKINSTS